MNDLADWLLEQIAEDERIARDGTPLEAVTGHAWRVIEVEERGPGIGKVTNRMVVAGARPSLVARLGMDRERRVSTHIVTWDPRRVLAECDAKRRRIALHAGGAHDCPEVHTGTYPDDPDDPRVKAGWGAPSSTWSHVGPEHFEADTACPTLRAETLPYAGRPGYREEWKP